MKHTKTGRAARKQLVAYLHNELNEQDRQLVEAQLETCAACRAELAAHRQTMELLGEALEAAPAPAGLKKHIFVKTFDSGRKGSFADLWYSPKTKATLLTAAACLLFFVLSGSLVVVSVYTQREGRFAGRVAARSLMRSKKPEMKLQKQSRPKKQRPLRETPARFSNADEHFNLDPVLADHDYEVSGGVILIPEISGVDGLLFDGKVSLPEPLSASNEKQTWRTPARKIVLGGAQVWPLDSYGLAREALLAGRMPLPEQVQTEVFVNRFSEEYSPPTGTQTFAVYSEMAPSPFRLKMDLLKIGVTLRRSATLREVKIRVEFNPVRVTQYHPFAEAQFCDETDGASDPSVTALYDVELKPDGLPGEPIATVYVRYCRADTGAVEEVSSRITEAVRIDRFADADSRFKVAACVAEFSEKLRRSPYAEGTEYEEIRRELEPAAADLLEDADVQELLRLIGAAR